jgi:hypothetical protein
MKNKILLTTLIAIIFSSFFFVSFAQADLASEILTQGDAFAGDQGANFGESRDVREVVGLVIKSLLGITGTLFLGYFIYAGYMWMTAAGDSGKIDTAKSTMRNAILGVVLTLSAYGILNLVVYMVGTSGREYDALEEGREPYYSQGQQTDTPFSR